MTILVPQDGTPAAQRLLSGRRGQILGFAEKEDWPGWDEVQALVPEAEILRYSTDLRSMTQGRGSYELKFSHYEEVPEHIAKEIIAAYEKTRNGEEED